MRVTVSTADGDVFPIEVGAEETVENVKAIMEVETNVPMASQIILLNGKPISDGLPLNAAGVQEDDMLLMVRRQAQAAPVAEGGRSNNPAALAQDGSALNPLAMMDQLYADAHLMQRLSSSRPALADAIRSRDVNAFQAALRETSRAQREAEEKQRQELAALMADPLNPENQAKIAEMINQKNVQEAYENAMEYNPELFGGIVMLYVNMEVNGHTMKAFVDSGAQSTIMSQKCAEHLGIMRLCDKRFAGIAKGVGTSKIIGRVHAAPIKVGKSHLTASITILEQDDMEFLFGLDMLKRHQCCIDLMKNELRFGSCGESLPFLSEHELPSAARSEMPMSPKHTGVSSQPSQARNASGGETSAAQQSGAAPGPGPAAISGTPDEEAKIQQLVQLGFPRDVALQALRSCGGDVDQAASVLFGGF